MKKIILISSMVLLLGLLTGCGKNNQNGEEGKVTITPTLQPTVTVPAEITEEDILTIEDYYTLQADTEYVYEGEGNEYAAYRMYVDFLDPGKNKVQTRTNNGGTETVRVIEKKDGKLSVIYMINECYYRDNAMDVTTTEEDAEVLLMEPLVEGTEWTLPDGRKRFISETEVQIETPFGSYTALEVTTESDDDSNTRDYYAPEVGLVKTIFQAQDTIVTSSLSEMNADTPLEQFFEVFYPDSDEKIYVEPITLTFRTGDITRLVLQEALKEEVAKDTYLPLIGTNTKLNSLYLGEDNIVYVDFSADLVKEMNAGAGYETLILQSITNTLGNYYGSQEVYITLDNKLYESGHVAMKEGETFKVNMDLVVR